MSELPANSTLRSIALMMQDSDGKLYRIMIGVPEGMNILLSPLVQAAQAGAAAAATVDLTEDDNAAGVINLTEVDTSADSFLSEEEESDESFDSVAQQVKDHFKAAEATAADKKFQKTLKDLSILDSSTETLTDDEEESDKVNEKKVGIKMEPGNKKTAPVGNKKTAPVVVKVEPTTAARPTRVARAAAAPVRRSRRAGRSTAVFEEYDSDEFGGVVPSSQEFF